MWDAVNLRWNAWLMEYSRHEQIGLWERLWINVWLYKVSILLWCTLLTVISGAIILYRYRHIQSRFGKDQVLAAYRLFCRKLERVGIKREASQGPRDFSLQVGVLRSDLKNQVNEIIQHYIDLRYATKGDATSAKKFFKTIRKFHPRMQQHKT